MSPELHIFGQLTGFQRVDQESFFSNEHLFLNYSLVHGDNWQLISGKQYSITASSDGVWSEPLDWHFTLSSIQNWPKLKVCLRQTIFSDRLTATSLLLEVLRVQGKPLASEQHKQL